MHLTAALVALWAALAVAGGTALADEAAVKRGKYLLYAGGCIGCHTDTKNKGPILAGGGPLKTPFGTFYAPNITPHPVNGIGKWSEANFIRAMRKGLSPDGSHYFPVFPYPSFTGITDADLKDLKAYLFSLKPQNRPNKEHDIDFPFGWRFLQTFWRLLSFTEGPYKPDPGHSDKWNRGAYLVNALTHCAECHTPRTSLGGLKTDMWMAGLADGPEGELAPNITPDSETGIGDWSPGDLATYLEMGQDPDGDFAGSLMAEVIEHGTSNLTASDIAAIAEYLRSLPPIRNKVTKPKKK